MRVLSIKVPIRKKKSGNLFNDPRIYIYIYIFQHCCYATYIGCTFQRREVRIKQHVPSDICSCTTFRH